MSIDQVAEKKSILNLLCEIILVFTKCPSDEPNDPENDNPNDLDEPDDYGNRGCGVFKGGIQN